jgi:hypothetical protein
MRPRQPSDTQKPQTAKQQANDRLAQALRDNLHRRKAQARARTAAPATDAGGTIPSDEKSPTQ